MIGIGRTAIAVAVTMALAILSPVRTVFADSLLESERRYIANGVGVEVPLASYAFVDTTQPWWGETIAFTTNGTTLYYISINYRTPPGMESFVIAHELGHVYRQMFGLDKPYTTIESVERATDKFAYCYGSAHRVRSGAGDEKYGSCDSLRAMFQLLLHRYSRIQ